MTSPIMIDRLMGALVGLVIGDALGVPVEFTGRASRDADPVTDLRGFGTHNQPPGTWSDDGALALAAADCLATAGWDLEAMKNGFVRWVDEAWWTAGDRVFDIGNATRWALARARRGEPWSACGGTDESDNGNGSLMRILPASLWCFGRETAELVARVGDASAITHAHLRSRLCCAYHALWCEALLSGRDAAEAVHQAGLRLRPLVPATEHSELADLLDGGILRKARALVRSDGYVVSTLEASCWCLHQHPDFAGAVLAAVNLGGDTDTTGAVAGGMAGLRCGFAGIPPHWVRGLRRHEEVVALAEHFAHSALAAW